MQTTTMQRVEWPDVSTVRHATAEQVLFYNEEGYLKFGRIFSSDEMLGMSAFVDRMIASLPEGKRPEEMDTPHFEHPELFRYLADPRVLDMIESFIGPDIVLWSSHFIAKPKGNGKAVPWHTDGAYWNKRLEPMKVITLWMAVDESSVENGCMRVIPRSHTAYRAAIDAYTAVDSAKNVFGSRIPPELIDEDRAVNLELRVGECHFHDAWTIHGSNPNFSEKRRCGYTMRYMPANAVIHPAPNRPPHYIYLLRGSDQTGGRNEYAPIPEYTAL